MKSHVNGTGCTKVQENTHKWWKQTQTYKLPFSDSEQQDLTSAPSWICENLKSLLRAILSINVTIVAPLDIHNGNNVFKIVYVRHQMYSFHF